MIPIKDLPAISSLASDYIYNFHNVSEFFNGDFREKSSLLQQAEKVHSRYLQRERLADILERQNKAYGCGRKTLENIKKISKDRTCAVVTGQQAGLFSGPLYTIYKALTAIKLAEELNQWGAGKFVPVFWIASDDHDFEEINHVSLIDKTNRVEKIAHASPTPLSKIPVLKIHLTSEIEGCIRTLKDKTHDTEFKKEVLNSLSQAYSAGRSFVEAFGRWMTRLFGSYGLIFIDAGQPEFKELGKEVFYKEISEDSPISHLAFETSKKLAKKKYTPQVQIRRGFSSLFYGEKERYTVQLTDKGYRIKDTQKDYKKDEFLGLLKKNPSLFSPNALLRPIYQDFLLPTAAYIGGPGEISYYAQLKSAYESFRLPMPIIFPRISFTLVEKKIENVLKAHDLKIQEVWHSLGSEIKKTSEKVIPGAIDSQLRKTAARFSQDFESLRKEIFSFDQALESTVDLSKRRIDHQFDFLKKKILQAAKKQSSMAVQQLLKVKNNIYPDNHLQERVLNVVPFLIKYSTTFIDKLYNLMELENYNHQIIKINDTMWRRS
jgi:bacillithiol biosynthesis cysteine-adding enzyme BshC